MAAVSRRLLEGPFHRTRWSPSFLIAPAEVWQQSASLAARAAAARHQSRSLFCAFGVARRAYAARPGLALVRPRFRAIAGGQASDRPVLDCEIEERRDVCVIRLAGEVDLLNAKALRVILRSPAPEPRHVVLDLRNLRYIDSAGVHVLLERCGELQQADRHMAVVNASPTVHRVFDIVGLSRRTIRAASVDRAMQLLAG